MRSLAGTGTLLRVVLRRDRVRLPVWVLAIALSVMGSVSSFETTFPTAADRQARADVFDNAMAAIFTGPGYGLDDYTFGAMTANEMLPITAIAVALMSIFLVVRHTRTEEETGRADLLRAAVVGSHAHLAAALIAVAGANVVLAALLTVGLPATLEDLSTSGSLAFAASLASVGIVFAGVGAFAAQLTVNTRTALGIGSIAMGGAYIVRSMGDMVDAAALRWISPFGWATETRAYVDERWWPLVLAVVLAAGFVAAAVAVDARRDVGAGIVADRPGPARASPRLATAGALARRLQRGSVVAWSIPLFLLGLAYGGIAREAADFYEDIDALEDYLERIGAAAPDEQYLSLTIFISALVAAGFAIQSALRSRSEETAQRAEPVLSGAVSRVRWLGSHVAVAMGGSVVLLFALGAGAGIGHALGVSDAGQIPRMIGAALAYAPALWVFTGLAAVVVGVAPRAVGALWAAFGVFALSGAVGPILQLPDWFYDLSPVEHIPRVPASDVEVLPLVILTALAAGLLVVGVAGIRRRDLAG